MAGNFQDGLPTDIAMLGARVQEIVSTNVNTVQGAMDKTVAAAAGPSSSTMGGTKAMAGAVLKFVDAEKVFNTDATNGGVIYRSAAFDTADDYDTSAALSAAEVTRAVEGLQDTLEMSGQDIANPSYQNTVADDRWHR